MKTIFYNNPIAHLFLFPGYDTIMLFGFILTKNRTLSAQTITHERIHVRQWLECSLLAVPLMLLSWWFAVSAPFLYYIVYLVEYLVRLVVKRNASEAYRDISFEREAYRNQRDGSYLNRRLPFGFIKYLKR